MSPSRATWGFLALLICAAVAGQRLALADDTSTNAPPPVRLVEVGVGARFMPAGWFELADPAGRSFRAYPALGGEVFADLRLTPVVAVGLAGEITANVIPNRSAYQVGNMWASVLRLSLRYPTSGRFVPFAMVTGGYSTISLASGPSASGPLVGGWLGCRLTFGTRHALSGQLGYVRGFQTQPVGDYAPSYVVTELGWMVGL